MCDCLPDFRCTACEETVLVWGCLSSNQRSARWIEEGCKRAREAKCCMPSITQPGLFAWYTGKSKAGWGTEVSRCEMLA